MAQSAIIFDNKGPFFVKDPRARLVVKIDWSEWLDTEGLSLLTSTWDVPAGLTADGAAVTGGMASVFVSGGEARKTYVLRNTITCSQGAVDSRSLRVVVEDR